MRSPDASVRRTARERLLQVGLHSPRRRATPPKPALDGTSTPFARVRDTLGPLRKYKMGRPVAASGTKHLLGQKTLLGKNLAVKG